MSPSSGYEDEMGRFLRLSDEELSRLLAGEAGVRDVAFDEVASLLGEARDAFATAAPDEATRGLHLAAISEASHLAADKGNPVARPVSNAYGSVHGQMSGLPKWRRVMDRMVSIALKGLAGTVAASMSMFGLAYAGVDLPGKATERALEAVTGMELPNQSSEESVADDVKSAVDSDLEGCERGQAVADAADANRRDEATIETDPCAQADEAGEGRGSKATGEEKSAKGRAKASQASGGASDGGAANAGEASGGASGAGADNAGTNGDAGRATGEGASSTGSSNASTNDDAGRATGEGASSTGSSNASTNDDAGRAAGEDAASTGSSNADSGGDNSGSNDDEGRATGESSTSSQEQGAENSDQGQGPPAEQGRP